MKLIQLDISAIRASDSKNNAYVLLLNEVTGKRQLPIVIGWCEARSIAIALDGNELTERPLTHDLFKNFSEKYNITLTKIIIHSLHEGIFHSSFYCKDKTGEEIEIDSRTSDSIALAIRFSCPIFTYEDVLKRAGIIVTSKSKNIKLETKSKEKKHGKSKNKLDRYSLQELNELLKYAIEKEDYEKASILRDEIKRRKKT